jgi:hypothetical protein
VGPFFFEGTVTGAAYFNILQESIVPTSVSCMEMRTCGINKTGRTPHYHRDVTAYLDNTFPDRWIGRRGSVEYPPRSPDLTPTDFFLWGYLKDVVYSTKPATLQKLHQEIERFCLAVLAETLVATCQSAAHAC